MTRAGVEAIVRALDEAGGRYLIAGGLAVVAHGHLRYTADVHILLDLENEKDLRLALQALESLGYAPRLPVPASGFADGPTREKWVREKGMKVFSMFHPEHPETGLDLFVENPLNFGPAWSRAYRAEVAPGLKANFVSFDDLIRMKRDAGRRVDLDDIERLEAMRRERTER